MSINSKYRVHEVGKDFNKKSTDILALLTEYFGENPKNNHMTALSENELDLLFDYFTQKHQVTDMNEFFKDCMDQAAKIAEEKKKEEAKAVPPTVEKAPQANKEQIKSGQEKIAEKAESKQATTQSAVKPIQNKAAANSAVSKQQPVHNNSVTGTVDNRGQQNRPVKKQPPARQQLKKVEPLRKNVENDGAPVVVVEKDDKNTAIPAGTVKFVDTRTPINVNLAKYDERLNEIAGEKGQKDYGRSKQKIKNKNRNKRPMQAKKEDEQARLRRMEQYEKDKKKHLSNVVLPEQIAVSELAARLRMTNAEVVKKLMLLGIMASASQIIDYDTASLVAEELGAKVSKEVVVTIEDQLIDDTEDIDENLEPRSPVVVVMGHVDHGKTSLLDAIRDENVVSGEAGGITQHIGAYTVKINDRDITFLDTPGHAAFTSMRARGAQVTDVVIIVVAADDGIMPQTIEAINHAKAAQVPIIVAVNKMDKPAANFDKVLQNLTEHELVPEAWGGDIICVPVSAKKREGIEQLLEMVLLVSDMQELKANPNREAKGTVIEAKLDKGRGPVATVLVQNGTLRMSDVLVAGTAVGRVRVMIDDKGNRIKEAGPSVPVEIVGLSEVPSAGDIFHVVKDERMARELVEERKHEKKEEIFKERSNISLDDLFAHIQEGSIKDLNIIVKADVQGSVEAVRTSLEKLSNEEVRVKVIHSAVGSVTESDVMLADASNAIIVGFNVRPDNNAKVVAEKSGIDIRLYRIIYDCIEEIESAMKGMLAPKFKEVSLGSAEVRQSFKVTGVGTIAGCHVKQGKIVRSAEVRLVRDGIVVYEGKIDSLKRFKDDAKEVAEGFECGIGLDRFNDIKDGDIIEAFINEEIKN